MPHCSRDLGREMHRSGSAPLRRIDEDLVAVAFGRDRVRMRFEVRDPAILVLRHAEEVVLFLDERRRREVIGAVAVDQLLLGVEALTAGAVQAAVAAEVDVALGVDAAEELLHGADMVLVRGADEVVVAETAVIPGLAEDPAHALGVRARLQPRRRRRRGDLVAVLVGAGDEEGPIATGAMKARQACRRSRSYRYDRDAARR